MCEKTRKQNYLFVEEEKVDAEFCLAHSRCLNIECLHLCSILPANYINLSHVPLTQGTYPCDLQLSGLRTLTLFIEFSGAEMPHAVTSHTEGEVAENRRNDHAAHGLLTEEGAQVNERRSVKMYSVVQLSFLQKSSLLSYLAHYTFQGHMKHSLFS